MTDDEQKPDLDALAATVVRRLDLLSAESSTVSAELAELVAEVREAIETDDREGQVVLMGKVETWLKGDLELREDIRNVFHLFYMYVQLRNDIDDEDDGV